MQALKELFTSDVGLLSLGSIVFMLGMGVFYLRDFLKHMHEDEQRHARHSAAARPQGGMSRIKRLMLPPDI